MSDFENLDYYALLSVSRSASLDEIKRAYRREISKYHPDRFVNGTPEEQAYARRRSQRLTEAYRVLGDFAERSAYNRGQASAASGSHAPRPAPAPAQPRDHQAELYEQAQRHLAEDRLLQAIGVLRQLQQINPFYRDSAELLNAAEARLNRRQQGGSRRVPHPLLVAGGVMGSLGLALLAAWAIGMRGATASRSPTRTSAPVAIVATGLPTRPPEPSVSAPLPTEAPATAEPATTEPTSLPTEAPASSPTTRPPEPPTAAASPTPFDFPTVTPTTAPAGEGGGLLIADDFSQGGWANLRGPGWQVGYQGQRYRISASQGLGTIWSYRTGPAKDVSIGVDMQAAAGEGGLLVRFQDAGNYVSISLNPSRTSFRVEQHDGGATNVIAGGQSEAIQTGADATNRLVVRLRGSSMDILVNGQSLASADAPGAPDSARYGLLVITTDSRAEAFFDNLEIRRLE
jgi:hypothetical protein